MGDQNWKWMQCVTTIFFKIACVHVVVHYHLFCFFLVLFSELIWVMFPRLTLRGSEKTNHDNSTLNAAFRLWTQTIAPSDGGSEGGSPPSFPLSRVSDRSMKQAFRAVTSKKLKMFHQNCFKRRNWNNFSKTRSKIIHRFIRMSRLKQWGVCRKGREGFKQFVIVRHLLQEKFQTWGFQSQHLPQSSGLKGMH